MSKNGMGSEMPSRVGEQFSVWQNSSHFFHVFDAEAACEADVALRMTLCASWRSRVNAGDTAVVSIPRGMSEGTEIRNGQEIVSHPIAISVTSRLPLRLPSPQ